MARNDAIGTGAIVLSANSDRLVAGLAAAKTKVETWGRSFKPPTMGGMGGGMLGSMIGSGSGIASKLGPVGLAVGGLAAGAGAAYLAFDKMSDRVQDIAKLGNIADAMGMTPEQFTGIAGVAKSVGEDSREFIESMVTLGKVASEGAEGKGEVAADFFKQLNIDAKEFVALRPDQQFFKFFEAVQKVESPLQRTRMLMTAFGEDGGKYLLPLLSKTPDELRKMAAGFAISSAGMEDARRASEALNGANARLSKAWDTVVIAAAPAIGMIAEGFGSIVEMLTPAGEDVKAFFKTMATVGAYAFDTLKAGAGGLAVAFGVALEYGLAPLIDALAKLANLAKEMPGAPAWVGKVADNIQVAADAVHGFGAKAQEWGKQQFFNFGKTAETVERWFSGVGKKAAPGMAGPANVMQAMTYTAPMKFAEAFSHQSKEAYSLEMRHQFGLTDKKDVGREQLDQLKKVNKNLEKGNAMAANNPVAIKVIR